MRKILCFNFLFSSLSYFLFPKYSKDKISLGTKLRGIILYCKRKKLKTTKKWVVQLFKIMRFPHIKFTYIKNIILIAFMVG